MRRMIFKIKIWFKTKQTIRKLHKAERKRLKKVKQMLLDDIIKAKVRQSVYNLGTVSVQFLVEGMFCDSCICSDKEFETIITDVRDRYGISLSWNDGKQAPKHYTIYLYND